MSYWDDRLRRCPSTSARRPLQFGSLTSQSARPIGLKGPTEVSDNVCFSLITGIADQRSLETDRVRTLWIALKRDIEKVELCARKIPVSVVIWKVTVNGTESVLETGVVSSRAHPIGDQLKKT